MANVISFKFTDNKQEVLDACKAQIIDWLDAIGEDASATASTKCPVDTGDLKNSIDHTVDPSNLCVYVGTSVDYAIYHEFGTGRYAEGGGGRQTPWMFQDKNGEWHWTTGVPARHFIQFGATAHQAEYKSMLESILKG
jgi:phage gpG-like protein